MIVITCLSKIINKIHDGFCQVNEDNETDNFVETSKITQSEVWVFGWQPPFGVKSQIHRISH